VPLLVERSTGRGANGGVLVVKVSVGGGEASRPVGVHAGISMVHCLRSMDGLR
jgi:hypothetical protein